MARWCFRRDGAFSFERGGVRLLGAGIAARLEGSGPERFAAVRAAAARVAGELSGDRTPAPLALGGFAFAPPPPRSGLWQGFADASFVLPRWTYRDDGRHAWLGLARLEGDQPTSALEVVSLGEALFGPEGPPLVPPAVASVDEEGESLWRERVERALDEIRANHLVKVVCARRATVSFETPPEVAAILARLPAAAEVTRFAVRRGARVFFGASPERLVARHGSEVRTEALAGTAVRGEGLLGSLKDRHEQRVVVEDIAARLAGLCTVVEAPAEPQLRDAPGVTHLHSGISARSRAGVHLLDLVAALHPTSAVGGLPAAAALAFLRAHEPARGWYAGGVGWFSMGGDDAGDGEIAVGIRSGLLAGDRAELYAGAGIVEGSDPRSELRETDWKLAPMLAALGARG
jgi:menaquinone-specific isochorismate synthase